MDLDTSIVHTPRVELEKGNTSVVSPIYQSGKFTFDKMADLRRLIDGKKEGFLYTRYGNPTVRELELALMKLQGTEEACCFASGVSAIAHTLLALLQSGDRLLLFWESYKPTRYLAKNLLNRFGIKTEFISIQDMDLVHKKMEEFKPHVVLFETPTNPCLAVADIEGLCTKAQEIGALTVLDNTFAGPTEHVGVPVDLYIHSLSKHICGHSDVIAGAVLGRKELINKHRFLWIQLGACLDPHAAYLVQRGLKTFQVRMERQCESAMKVASALSHDFSQVMNVSYPGLKGHPQYQLAQKQMKRFGQVLSFDLADQSENALDHFIDRLKLFQVTGSIGSIESLVAPVELFYGGDLSDEEKRIAGINGTTIRLSIGLESPDDLLKDLQQALN